MSFLNTLKFITNHPLNREHKLNSIIRFIKWQISSRLIPGVIVYDWVNGSKFLVKNGETGLTGNIYCGLYEFSDMAFLLHVLRDDDLFIDIGANAGSYTILAGSTGARGCAFEPVPSTYARLIENIRLNHLEEKTKCINKGVGAEQGTITFTSDRDTVNHALASGEKCDNTIDVGVTSLDIALKHEAPNLMKIDVEGYETLVLNGAEDTLKKKTLHSVIMELNESGNRYGFDETSILELMFDHDFKTFSYNPLDRTLTKLKSKNLNSSNTLFIRDKSFVLDRLINSQKASIHGAQFPLV